MALVEDHAAEQKVRSWGSNRVFTWKDPPHAYYKPHSREGLTTHLVLSGNLTISYPEDDPGKNETHGIGARFDVPANRVHEVWVDSEGCTMVVGE